MKKRRHHYIWRKYLRPWAKNEQIWCLRENKIFNANLMNIGQERDFYRLHELSTEEIRFLEELINRNHSPVVRELNHGWLELLTATFKIKEQSKKQQPNNSKLEEQIEEQIINLGEDFHGKIEENAIKIIDELLNKETNILADEEKAKNFIHYLCVQYFRTKNMKNRVSVAVSSLGLLDTDKAWTILTHIFATSVASSIYIELDQWKIVKLKNKTALAFITGDQPVLNTYAAFNREANEHEELELYYPLSPQLAIILTRKKEYENVSTLELGEPEIAYYNGIMADMSDEQIYSESKEQLEYELQHA